MKITHIIIMLLAVLLLVSPASAWIAGYGGRQAVNVIGDATWSGNATYYPIVLEVSNANGVSYQNKIFLNGTGSAFTSVGGYGMINDLRFTDTSDNLYPYWIEHTASNNSYWKCWVNISTIYKNSTSLVYIYYGNSAATFASSANTTFVIGDDFTNATVDTTIWNYNATQVTPTISGGIVAISSPSTYGLYSKNLVPNGYELRAYASKTITTPATWIALVNGSAYGSATGQYSTWQWRTASAGSSPVSASTGVGEQPVQFTTGGYHIYNIFKQSGGGTYEYIDDGAYKLKSGPDTWYFANSNDAYNQSVWLGGDSTSANDRLFVNWVMIRPNWTPTPTISLGNAGPTVWFIANRTSASSPADIQFTDQSYGNPTSWQWNFGDGTTPAEQFTQSPVHTYQVDGTYNVSLTAGNTNGTNTATRYNYITISKTNLTPGYGTYYNPKTTTFHIQTAFGAPIVGATVTAQGINTTMGDWAWLYQILGINQETTPIGTQNMTGITDTNGDVQFMMIPTGYFEISIFKTGVIDKTITVTPTDDKYVVMADWSVWGTTGQDVLAVDNFNLTTSQHNATYKNISVTGTDTLGHFTGGTVYLNQTVSGANLTSEITLQSQSIPASNFTLNFFVTNYSGQSYLIHVVATQSDFGTVKHDFGVSFPMTKVNPMGLDNKTLMFISIVILFGTGAMFTATTAHNGGLLTCFVGWLLYMIGWMDYGGATVPIGLTLATIISIVIIIVVGRTKS